MTEWTCPHCGERLPPQKLDYENARKREVRIPLAVEWLSILGITLISISVAISVFVTYQITNSINGNVISRISQLQASIDSLTTAVNGDVLSQIGQLQQFVSTGSHSLGTSNPQASMNVLFSCADSATNALLPNCHLHIRLLEETPVSEFEVASDNQTPVIIHRQRRLEITATKDGYKTTTEIFEYTEDGSAQPHSIRLERVNP